MPPKGEKNVPEICTNIEACIFYSEDKVDDIHKKRTVVYALHTNKNISFVKKKNIAEI